MTCKICGRQYSLGDDPIIEYQTCTKCRNIIKLLYDHTHAAYPDRTDLLYITCDTCNRIIGIILDPNSLMSTESVTICGQCATPGRPDLDLAKAAAKRDGAFRIDVKKYRDLAVDNQRYHVFACPKCGIELYYGYGPSYSYPQGITCSQSNDGCGAQIYPKFVGKPS